MTFAGSAFACRLLTPQDAGFYEALYTSRRVMQFIAPPLTTGQARESLAQVLKAHQSDSAGLRVWLIEDHAGQAAGIQMLKRAPANADRAEAGIMLAPHAQKSGIAQAALTGMLRFGFDNLGFRTIEAYFDHAHNAAKQLVSVAGFRIHKDTVQRAGRQCCHADIRAESIVLGEAGQSPFAVD
ncbi:GNAT family N-acetyltransferase [Alteromonas sp. CYL-A6]|uniref:GNAT family N-acetyltransferase n=1 Tax=Alteromonas nitratireducens TaxID=3390813 RepID=UPI0034B4C207